MITNVRGDFTDFSAEVTYDPHNPAATRVEAGIKAASINTQNQKRDDHLRSGDFFDVQKFPEITFTGHSLLQQGSALTLTGDLSLHGVTKEVTLTLEGPTEPVRDPWGNERIGVVARTVIHRKDFGLTWNQALESGGVLVGEEVNITLDLSLIREK